MAAPSSTFEPALLGALARAGTLVAVVEPDGRVTADPEAAQLGDPPELAALAQAALAGPVTVAVDGAPWLARTVRDGDRLVLVAHRDGAAGELAALDAFLHFASHELKGPLHVLGLACHLIETRAARGDRVEPANVDQIRRQVHRLTRQINELLEVGRLRQGRVELLLEDVDLAEVAQLAVARVDRARVGDVVLCAPAPVKVRADRARVSEIIDGLVDNAVRFTQPGTRVEVGVAAGAGSATVTVADHGPGVAAEEEPALFSFAVERQARRGRVGLGLGLHLSRALARLHGGDLEYQRNAPTGARFTLTLPR